MDEVGAAVKSQLEISYDIPFHIENSNEYRDRGYRLWPDNEIGELFEIHMLYRQGIRLIIEVQPQRYAAGMLNDMQNANKGKIGIFLKYIEVMRKNRAKVEMNVNNNLCKTIDYEVWNQPWKTLKFRISVIPEREDTDDYEKNMFVSWSDRVVGMMLVLLNIEKTEDEKQYLEGGVSQVLINKYERNPVNRQLCLMTNGYICKVCGFDFEAEYGELGYQFIHIHHIEKVSLHEEEYVINPEKDLIPVCPNCHAMFHRINPPLLPEELVAIIKKVRTGRKGE
jgi:5-methylcytosine-specific restriction protein A